MSDEAQAEMAWTGLGAGGTVAVAKSSIAAAKFCVDVAGEAHRPRLVQRFLYDMALDPSGVEEYVEGLITEVLESCKKTIDRRLAIDVMIGLRTTPSPIKEKS